ncbi:MAG: class I SAM-dependent methyltransferase [Kofleriaceae bacterium]
MSAAFVGSIPAVYDRHLGPVLFEPYAIDLAGRLPATARHVLEVAAGTGRVTRHLLARMPGDGALVASDLNAAMLARAREQIEDPRVSWQVADAQALPFEDGRFDAVVCQFGLMFVPDQALALRELARVLRPGGMILLSTWDQLARNGATQLAHELAVAAFPVDPPLFYLTPFSLDDPAIVCDLLAAAGFVAVHTETVAIAGECESAASLATGLVQGNPFHAQLLERGLDPAAFEHHLAEGLAKFGDRPCRSPMSAHVYVAKLPG